ncbi:MAG: hypothetical protein R3D59_14165 [Paracoccaceae bacterium]
MAMQARMSAFQSSLVRLCAAAQADSASRRHRRGRHRDAGDGRGAGLALRLVLTHDPEARRDRRAPAPRTPGSPPLRGTAGLMRPSLKLLLLTLPFAAAGAGFLGITVRTKAPPARIEAREVATPVRVIPATETSIRPLVTGYGLSRTDRDFRGHRPDRRHRRLEHPEARPRRHPARRRRWCGSRPTTTVALSQAEANIRAAEAKLAELAVSEDNQRAALDIERDVLALRADELARAEALLAGGARAQAAVDTARAAWLAQRQKVQSVESTLALIPSQRAGLAETAAAARAAGATARLNLARTTLTLPFAARVAQVSVETGRYLRAGETAAQLDGTASAEVEAQVPVAALRRLLRRAAPDAAAFAADPAAMTRVLRDLDLDAELRLDLDGDVLTWPGRVDRVSDTVDPKTGTLGVIVVVDTAYAGAIPGARPPLTKGMFVEAAISGPPVTGFAMPRSAVADGRVRVTDHDDRLEHRAVTTAFSQGDISLITNGLSSGDRVVASDLLVPVEGMLLAPVTDDTLAATLGPTR